MHFTILSVIVFAVVGLVIFSSYRRGLKKGLSRSAATLGINVLAAVLTLLASTYISDYPAKLLSKNVYKGLSVVRSLAQSLPSIEDLTTAIVDALLTCFIFALLYPLVRLILRIAVNCCCRPFAKRSRSTSSHIGSYASANASDAPDYSPVGAPWHVKNDRLLGGIVSAFCGFLTFLFLTSPLVGTLSVLSTFYNAIDGSALSWKSLKLKDSALEKIEPYINDAGIATLGAFGGDLVFDTVATSNLLEHNMSLGRELDSCIETAGDLTSVLKAISSPEEMTSDQKRTARALGKEIGKSDTMCMIASDFMRGASEKWGEDEKYLGISRPNFGSTFNSLMNGVLGVFAESEPKYVAEDVSTLMNIYLLVSDAGLFGKLTNEELVAILEDGSIMNDLYAELAANERMAPLTQELVNTSMRIMSENIINTLSNENREVLMDRLADSISRIASEQGLSMNQKVDKLSQDAIYYADKQGLKLPQSVADMASATMLNTFGDSNLSGNDMKNFFDFYTSAASGN